MLYLRPLLATVVLAHLLLFCAGCACSAEETKLPADAARLVEAFDTDAAKLRADAEKAVEKKAAVLANALQVVQEKLTKKGDLEGAMAVKTKIAGLGVKSDKPLNPATALVGRWAAVWDKGTIGANLAHEVWTVEEDGTCLNGQVHGKWLVKNGGFEIRWDIGFVDTIKTLTEEGTAATATRSNEKTISLKKQN